MDDYTHALTAVAFWLAFKLLILFLAFRVLI